MKESKMIFEHKGKYTLTGDIALQEFNRLNPLRFKVLNWNTFSPVYNYTRKQISLSIKGERHLFEPELSLIQNPYCFMIGITPDSMLFMANAYIYILHVMVELHQPFHLPM